MDMDTTLNPTWENRVIVISAFGLVGFGALLGLASIYILFIKHRLEKRLTITANVHEGRKESDTMKENSSYPPCTPTSRKSTNLTISSTKVSTAERRSIQFVISEHIVLGTVPSEASGDGGQHDETQVQHVLARIDLCLDGSINDQQEGYEILDAHKVKLQTHPEFWWRFARACHLEAEEAGKQQDKDLQKCYLQKAVSCAEQALKLNEQSANAHKWYAISLGSYGDFLKLSEKIQNGYIFKEHIDRAVALNPTDSSLHHLLGRFCFEVSKLSWIERRMAAALFTAPPTATVKEALDHFLNAEKLGDPFIENRFYISKCYIEMGDSKEAAKWLDSASQLPAVTSNDKNVKKSVEALLAKYQKHLCLLS